MLVTQTTKSALFIIAVMYSFLSYGDDSQAEIDKSRVFPVQKNPIVEHSQKANQSVGTAGEVDKKKPDPKDTKFNLDGNGGSTNRSAGGKAMLKQRIPFD
jgi:hypothetical protein